MKLSEKFANFPLTSDASLVFWISRKKAGSASQAESVFFSGLTSQFSAVDDCWGWALSCTGRMIFDSLVTDSLPNPSMVIVSKH